MVESEAKELSEEIMLGAVNYGKEQIQPVIAAINELKKEIGKPKLEAKEEDNSALTKEISDFVTDKYV